MAALAASGCSGSEPREARAPAVPVRVARFAAAGGAAGLVIPGRIKAAEEVTVRARLDARLTAFAAREGDRVARGAVLARFDAPETRAALEAARDGAAAAELSLALAVRQHARVESLFVAGVVSSRERELADGDRRTAEARASAARAELDRLERGAAVRSPFDAVVVRRHLDPGADVAAGAALLDLRSDAGAEAVADVPEGALASLRGAALRVQSGDGAWHPARLARLDGMTDFRSRTRTAHLALPPGVGWVPGAFARVAIGGGAGGAGLVPASSLVRRGAMAGVYVIEGGTTRLRWLRLGREAAEGVEVLAGLEPGDRFALESAGLADGRAVEPLEAPGPAKGKAAP